MELRHLRYFVAVAEEQNITRAAARLHVSQPPLSRQIADLERELGVKLFDRGPKSVRLTEAGRIFRREAREILRRADDAVAMMKEVSLGKRGKIRVGYATSPTVDILRRALESFIQTHPSVNVELREMTSQAMLRGLRERTLDVALTVAISPRDFEGLVVEDLGAYQVRVAFPRKHRFARLRAVPLGEVAQEPMVTFTQEDHPEARAGLLKILSAHTKSPKIVEEYEGVTSLIAAVEAGRGVALVFETVSLIAGPRLELRPVKPAPPLLPIAMVYRKDGLSAHAAAFVAAAKAAKRRSTSSKRALLNA